MSAAQGDRGAIRPYIITKGWSAVLLPRFTPLCFVIYKCCKFLLRAFKTFLRGVWHNGTGWQQCPSRCPIRGHTGRSGSGVTASRNTPNICHPPTHAHVTFTREYTRPASPRCNARPLLHHLQPSPSVYHLQTRKKKLKYANLLLNEPVSPRESTNHGASKAPYRVIHDKSLLTPPPSCCLLVCLSSSRTSKPSSHANNPPPTSSEYAYW